MQEVFLRVRVGAEALLFALSHVHEVLPMMRLKETPSQTRFRGVMNLRGALVPVFDAAAPDAPLDASRFILVIPGEEALSALIVDDVLDLVSPERVIEHALPTRVSLTALVEGEMLSILNPRELTA